MAEVEVIEYDPAWTQAFEQEAARLRQALGDVLLKVHHVGSTSVPGLAAKPVIDMLPVVTSIAALDRMSPAMEKLGYEGLGSYGLPGRRYFRRVEDGRHTHHVHAYQHDNYPEIVRHLAVPQYLRLHEDEARAYAALKRQLVGEHADDRQAYSEAKHDFVQALQARAIAWYFEL